MWFEPISAWIVALLTSAIPWLNEKTTKSIPAENWANKELQYKDRLNGMSEKDIVKKMIYNFKHGYKCQELCKHCSFLTNNIKK